MFHILIIYHFNKLTGVFPNWKSAVIPTRTKNLEIKLEILINKNKNPQKIVNGTEVNADAPYGVSGILLVPPP